MSSNHDHHPNDLPESGGGQKPGRATVVVHVCHCVGCVRHLKFSFATFKPSSHSLQKMTHSITAFHILKHVLIKCSQLFTFSAAFLSFAIFASKVQSFLIFCSNRLLFDAFATLELGLTFQHMEGKRQHHRSAELP